MTTKKESTKEVKREIGANWGMIEHSIRVLSDLEDARNARYEAYSELTEIVGRTSLEICDVLTDARDSIEIAPINKHRKKQLTNLLNAIYLFSAACAMRSGAVVQQHADGSGTLTIDCQRSEAKEDRVKQAEAVRSLVDLHSLLTNPQLDILRN